MRRRWLRSKIETLQQVIAAPDERIEETLREGHPVAAARIAAEAKRRGVTPAEYMRRRAAADLAKIEKAGS